MSSRTESSPTSRTVDLTQSGVTIPSDSENYESNNQVSSAPSSSNGSPLIIYEPPTIWGLLRGAAINLMLPFINGLMLGFGELFAHEIAFRLGWSGTKIFPKHRSSGGSSHMAGPGVEVREDSIQRRRRSGEEMDMYTSLE